MADQIPENEKTPYVFLGKSGMKVSNLCLGTLTFGECQRGTPGQTDVDDSHAIIKRYTQWGGNFIDTANVYGLGNSEIILGKWLETVPRENYVIATKCRASMGETENVNNLGLSRRHITDSIEKSLQRLHTDYVDLYQTHCFDDAVDIDETLRTLNDLVRVGKIHYVGVSNVNGWQLQKLVSTVERLGLNSIISLQQQYNLLSRQSELEPFQVCKQSGIGVLPWSPLKGGMLTGKLKRGVTPTEGRIAWMANKYQLKNLLPRWLTFEEKMFDVIEATEAMAKKRGRTIPQIALRWLLQKDVVSSVILGARTLAQLDDNMAVNGWSLTKEEMQELDAISEPITSYPYDFVIRENKDRINRNANDYYVKTAV